MTISTTTTPRIQYNGNGATTVFAVSYVFSLDEDLVVIVTDADGNDTTQTINTHYTVTGGGVPPATGSVTFLSAPADGTRVTIYRDTPMTQETDYIAYDAFPAESHEGALDKLTLIVQEFGETLDRTVTLSPATPTGVSATLPTPAASQYLRWNSTADALEAVELASLGTAIVSQTTNQTTVGASPDYQIGLSSTLVFPGTVKTASTGISYANTAGDFTATIKAPGGLSANYTLTLPNDDGSANQVLTTDGSGTLSWTSAASGAPTNASYVVLGTNGTLSDERVLTAGTGITITDAGAGSTVTISPNINGLTEDTSPDKTADFVMTYDTSATAVKKVKLTNLATTGGIVLKNSDELATSDTTMSNDADIAVTVAANTTYNFVFLLLVDTPATNAGFKFQITGPASPTTVTGAWYAESHDTTASSYGSSTFLTATGTFSAFSSSQTVLSSTTPYFTKIYLNVRLVNGVNSGTVRLQWAQNTSSASATTVLKGSYVMYSV